MPIKKANELISSKKYSVIIYAPPGTGKTTLALSSPNPILIDADFGLDRVLPNYRKPYIRPSSYQELLDDLSKPEDFLEFESMIIDTGGALVSFIKDWLIAKDAKNAQRDGVTLSIQGYGKLGEEFKRLVSYIRLTLQKNFVIVFHQKESNDGDTLKYVLDVEGSTKSNIWKPMDIGGYLEIVNNKRIITWGPTDRSDGKGTRGVSGPSEIPPLKGQANTFLADIFKVMDNQLQLEADLGQKYEETMTAIEKMVKSVIDAKTANEGVEFLKSMDHVYGTKTEGWTLLRQRAENLGYQFVDSKFVPGLK